MTPRREMCEIAEGFAATERQQEDEASVLEQILVEVRALNDCVSRWESWNEKRQKQSVLLLPRMRDYLENLHEGGGSRKRPVLVGEGPFI